jgi:zinc protease
MKNITEFELDNGLKVVHCYQQDTSLTTLNVLYNVGARNETPNKTGFAHLFEHLMFGGSINVPSFDTPLEEAGGKNNAFTNNDITNYYDTLPTDNIEVAFWLESDRMLSLAFNPESLDVQRKVVCEEFKEHYINQPYGDTSHLVRALAFTKHPYQWPTIGKNLEQIENATLDDVKDFFSKHYGPNNAILCIVGNIDLEKAKSLSNKWFAGIAPIKIDQPIIEPEPPSLSKKTSTVVRPVAANAFYMTFHGVARKVPDYYTMDIITDILSNGFSSLLYQKLCYELNYFSSINCYHYGSIDAGLIMIEGKLNPNITFEEAEGEIWKILTGLSTELLADEIIEKAKNKIESHFAIELIEQTELAFSLAYYKLVFGNASQLYNELLQYQNIDALKIKSFANNYFNENNSAVLYYKQEALV